MSVIAIQLKPHEELFYRIVREKITRLDALVLCEGFSDAEVAKRVLRKVRQVAPLGEAEQVVVGFTDCGGKDNVPFLAGALLALSRLARKLKSVLVIIDADEYTAEDKVRSFSDSLASKRNALEVQLGNFRRDSECGQVYISRIMVGGRVLKLVVAVNGDFSMPFRRHCLEDHCVNLMGISASEAVESAKHLIGDLGECLRRVEEAGAETVCKAFEHMCRAFQLVLA